jgi:hypothetical protein
LIAGKFRRDISIADSIVNGAPSTIDGPISGAEAVVCSSAKQLLKESMDMSMAMLMPALAILVV